MDGRYSYAVSLQDDVGHFCGGSLISKDVVLTAAHCEQEGAFRVVIGRHNLYSTDGDEVYIKTQMPHPKYNWKNTNNDFMLIFLGRPTLADVEVVKLNSDRAVPTVNDSVTVMGWGDTVASDYIQTLSSVLQAVELGMISNTECESSKGFHGGVYEEFEGDITRNMMCAKDSHQDACQGDSGELRTDEKLCIFIFIYLFSWK